MQRWWLALRSVFRAPGVIEHQLPLLLVHAPARAIVASRSEAERTVRLSHRLLGRFGRLRRLSVHRWRATCLYRSVAECLVLRELGFPARILIGARRDDTGGTIEAHAWVECEGITCASTPGDEHYEVLNAASAVTAVL